MNIILTRRERDFDLGSVFLRKYHSYVFLVVRQICSVEPVRDIHIFNNNCKTWKHN